MTMPEQRSWTVDELVVLSKHWEEVWKVCDGPKAIREFIRLLAVKDVTDKAAERLRAGHG